jgi:arginine kinase
MGACSSKDGVSEPKKAGDKAGAPATSTDWKSSEDLKDFDTFFPAGTKSSVCRHLTKEIWEEYKDQKDACGVTFKTCIYSGVKNLDSGIGVYAGSHDSYKCFNKFFDKVVEDYHGHGVDAKHQSEMQSAGLTGAELAEDEAAMIVSTRIRVGRNLADYPLGPGVTKEQRLEIMNKVVEAAKSFDDDLKGTFYPLDGMNKDVQQQLIDDHFLFK